jgi:thiol-disulfide isomerase/thioredoxin
MKKISLSVLLLFLFTILASSCTEKGTTERFAFSPKSPLPGEDITVVYDPSETNLASATAIEMVAYLYSKEIIETKGIRMRKAGDIWQGPLTTSEETRGVIIKFRNGQKVDDNQKKGYSIFMTTEKGDSVAGAKAGLATVLLSAMDIGFSINSQIALDYFEEDFKLYPNIKREYLRSYIEALTSVRKEEGTKLAIQELDSLAADSNLAIEDIRALADLNERLERPEISRKFYSLLRERDPGNDVIQFLDAQECQNTPDIGKKIELMNKFRDNYSHDAWMYTGFIFIEDIIRAYVKKGEYTKALEFLRNSSVAATPSTFQRLASTMMEKNIDLDAAEELAATAVAVNCLRRETRIGQYRRPRLTEEEWQEYCNSSLSRVLAFYGSVLKRLNKLREAFDVYSEAIRLGGNDDRELNEEYAEALVMTKDPKAALGELEKIITSGEYTPNVTNLLKGAYIKDKGSESGLDVYLKGLEKVANDSFKRKTLDSLIEEQAPEFALMDLSGKTVSLSELKGNVIVLDFWATWCGPCIASFPGMNKALDNYKNDPEVQFLFVDTMEHETDEGTIKKNAAEMMGKNNYPFQVILDNEGETAKAYGISSIPTKVIIDKEGNIRYRSIGYSGDIDRLVEELSIVIDSIK